MSSEHIQYEYTVVEMPANIWGEKGGKGEAARKLKSIIDEQAKDGFEFYRVDTFETTRPSGCLSFSGPKTITYNVVTFRRPKRS